MTLPPATRIKCPPSLERTENFGEVLYASAARVRATSGLSSRPEPSSQAVLAANQAFYGQPYSPQDIALLGRAQLPDKVTLISDVYDKLNKLSAGALADPTPDEEAKKLAAKASADAAAGGALGRTPAPGGAAADVPHHPERQRMS